MMTRLTYEQKCAAVERATEVGRPIVGIVKAKKMNNAPEYKSEELRQRSRATAKKRAERYKRMAALLASD
jgi:hypothetical protein